MSSTVRRRFQINPDASKQAFLLLAIFKEFLSLFLPVLRENVSLGDVHARFEALKANHTPSSDAARSNSPELSTSKSCNSDPTWQRLLLLEYPKADLNAVLDESPENRKVISALDRENELGTRLDGINGATPLHLTCMIANVDIIRLLVDHGAFFKAKDAEQREPIEYFDTHEQSDAIAVYNNMYSEWKGHDKFLKGYNKLIRKDKYEIFKRTIERYPDLASRTTDDCLTLLHPAVIRRGRRRIVEMLISTDKTLVNKRSVRSRYYSSGSSTFAPPTIPDKYVRKATPLHYACLVHDMNIAQLLLEAGVDWNIEDSEGRIPEDMIHRPEDTCYEMKSTFVRLRHSEEERRKEAGEKLRQSNDALFSLFAHIKQLGLAEALLSLEKQISEKLVGQRGPIRFSTMAVSRTQKYVVYPPSNPKAVVLLDEIEKAHPDVLNRFLQIFDDGRITDSEDGVIYCKDAIFIMTSNVAGEESKNAAPVLRQSVIKSEEGRPESYIQLIQSFTRSIRPQLKQHLKRDEFIGRVNQMVVFLPLSQEEIETAVQCELAMWCKRAEEKHKIKLIWNDEVVRTLASFYDVNYGVRSVANEVQRIAMQLVASASH
ncbi:hypothetical protein A7U60_g8668 [Sanghuangporus baumii]|uniref:ATPase AAA-type core domain-containing protein n=1 Tax=Sanghuangporus baumii TaxID=108892 RepID=A0A9Q5HQ88_SANBA|nr:hypothetical protein A7U60_g8668 [Sanghuangporus baumii]